jgi:plastocyanin
MLIAAALVGLAPTAQAHAETQVVKIENMQFTPSTIVVHRGDRVVWQNKDLYAHSATADARRFDSGNIAPNASWSYEASKTGRYTYGCSLHPTMHGVLIVQ